MRSTHLAGCTRWPIANPDGTVTCLCGESVWRAEDLLRTVRRSTRVTTRRARLGRLMRRLRAMTQYHK